MNSQYFIFQVKIIFEPESDLSRILDINENIIIAFTSSENVLKA